VCACSSYITISESLQPPRTSQTPQYVQQVAASPTGCVHYRMLVWLSRRRNVSRAKSLHLLRRRLPPVQIEYLFRIFRRHRTSRHLLHLCWPAPLPPRLHTRSFRPPALDLHRQLRLRRHPRVWRTSVCLNSRKRFRRSTSLTRSTVCGFHLYQQAQAMAGILRIAHLVSVGSCTRKHSLHCRWIPDRVLPALPSRLRSIRLQVVLLRPHVRLSRQLSRVSLQACLSGLHHHDRRSYLRERRSRRSHRRYFKVLVLDVRNRAEFEREHIKADAVVCIEPTVLLRHDVTAETIEDSLFVAPREELVLFKNRDKFDLVALYDDKSETFGDAGSPLSILVRAIYEVAFRQFLKHPPMLLVGGLQAWKREFGESELIRGGANVLKSNGSAAGPVTGLVNGMASVSMNGIGTPATSYAEQKSPSPGHFRAPAESSMATTSNVISRSEQSITGRHRAGTESSVDLNSHRPWIPIQPNAQYPPEQASVSLRPGVETPASPSLDVERRLVRRPAISRPPSASISYPYTPSTPTFSPTPAIPENTTAQHVSLPMVNGSTPLSPIQYPKVSRNISPQISGSSFASSPTLNGMVSVPPQASINPSPLSRRRSDYVDQSQEALSGLTSRPAIDYPDLSSQHVLRPPPIAASSSLERQDNRPRLMQSQSFTVLPSGPRPPTIQSDYPVTYWSDIQIGTSGLKNLGNTCYMNSTIQCLSATVPFARFFTDGRWKSAVNMMNPMGTKGNLAQAFANILRDMWQGELQCLSPVTFRRSLCMYAPQFGGTEQHDSQEFLNFLLDGLHEDLNRVLQKPQTETTPEREAELERLPTQIASEQEWQIWRMRNDSLIVDFFQGQFRNRLECLTCHKTSTTYNTFMYLTLPIPTGRGSSKVSLYQCLDAFVKEEVMEKSDAWNCPHCKTLRKATKNLSLSRLPPVLLIHLKRFSSKGHFTDKIETFVDYPLKSLDLTNYMPPPLPPGVNTGHQLSREDPRAQIPPYKYDLYAVTNHFGTLSSGHYTAFISSRGGWLYCDDSRISQADSKDVVGKPAYMLFYKRTKA